MKNNNNHLDFYDYKPSTGFVSTTKQINNHMDAFREANKKAIEENTAAINEQTNRLEAAINEQTERLETSLNEQTRKTVSVISAQTEQQNIQAERTRTNFTNIFGHLIDTVKSIFSKDKGSEMSGTTTFYEMIQAENDQTQAYLSGQTTTLNNALSSIKSQIENVKRSIDQNTSGDTVNAKVIKDAIEQIEININNHYTTP